MARIKEILLFLIIIVSPNLAQNFFPLKVGNAYQIENFWWWSGPGGNGDIGTDYYAITVIGDSVINGGVFYSFSENGVLKNGYLFGYDSLNQKVYVKLPGDSTLKLSIDFNAPSGSTFTSYLRGSPIQFTSEGFSNKVVLGDTHTVYSMHGSLSADNYTYQFADKVGLSYFRNWGGVLQSAWESKQNIISAILDSVIYNPLILSIDTLYPVEDRPIDTFPFLITIPYIASYSELIDSFYLSVEHQSADTLVQTKQYNISKSNPHISLYLTGLSVGDKIKLRATITDSTIFYNITHYPDTGWVVMNVLPPILNVENAITPLQYELAQNYPNPFNPSTTIRYQLPEHSFVTIKIYDVIGNEIETLMMEENNAGSYKIEFDGSKLSSGIYYYRISTEKFSQTRKMILLK